MSLNWKEINLILSELDLPGHQIQGVTQSAYDVLSLQLYGKAGPKNLLIALAPAPAASTKLSGPPLKATGPCGSWNFASPV
jgi:hypothetical protein